MKHNLAARYACFSSLEQGPRAYDDLDHQIQKLLDYRTANEVPFYLSLSMRLRLFERVSDYLQVMCSRCLWDPENHSEAEA